MNYEKEKKILWKIHTVHERAREIAREYKIKHGLMFLDNNFSIFYDTSLPVFQEVLHPAHNFNKYLKELHERYI